MKHFVRFFMVMSWVLITPHSSVQAQSTAKRVFKPYTINKNAGVVKIFRKQPTKLALLAESAIFVGSILAGVFGYHYFAKKFEKDRKKFNDLYSAEYKGTYTQLRNKYGADTELTLKRNIDFGHLTTRTTNKSATFLYASTRSADGLRKILPVGAGMVSFTGLVLLFCDFINYRKRFIPLVTFDQDGICYENEKKCAWEDLRDYYVLYSTDESQKYLVFEKRNGERIKISEREMAVSFEKAAELIKVAYALAQSAENNDSAEAMIEKLNNV